MKRPRCIDRRIGNILRENEAGVAVATLWREYGFEPGRLPQVGVPSRGEPKCL